MNYLMRPTTILILFALIGCGGGSNRVTNGEQCRKNLKFKDADPNQKIDLKPGSGVDEIQPGIYTYVKADLLFKDKTTNTIIHFQDVKKDSGTFKGDIACVRNYDARIEGLTIAIDGLASMEVDENYNTKNFRARSYGMTVSAKGIKTQFQDSDILEDGDSPSEPYDNDSKVQEAFFLKANDRVYQVHSTYILPEGPNGEVRELTVVATMVRKDLPSQIEAKKLLAEEAKGTTQTENSGWAWWPF